MGRFAAESQVVMALKRGQPGSFVAFRHMPGSGQVTSHGARGKALPATKARHHHAGLLLGRLVLASFPLDTP
jgi:hypothetical protein